jgi:vanillate/3-O-methylgallate O-demethylase
MAGAPGLEIWGPYADKHYIQSTRSSGGPRRGREPQLVGSRAYSTNTLESGWIPSPLPGIYTGDGMLQEYRDWLGADSYEAMARSAAASSATTSRTITSIRSSWATASTLDGKSDFIGKDALLKMKDAKNRKKVTLEWNRDDLLKVVASSFEEGIPYKWIDFPQPNYASTSADMLMLDKRMAACRCSTAIRSMSAACFRSA